MTAVPALRVVLVDPSLFTAPYDAALTNGLISAGVRPCWVVRPVRPGDREELAPDHVDAFFYRRTDQANWLPGWVRAIIKGIAHGLGLMKLVARVLSNKPDIVHFQWAVIPSLDALAMWVIRRQCPVILTIHDTVPFNGESASALQRFAVDLPMKVADRVIVHTRFGRDRLQRRGLPGDKLVVIPHGPLSPPMRAATTTMKGTSADARWTFLLFGELKRYKGIDIFIEAIGLLPPEIRSRARFIVAGRPQMDMAPLVSRIEELGLASLMEIRPHRLSEDAMADLFDGANCFVFPYRQVDASGVYFLVKSLAKWIIATDVGVFADEIRDGVQGAVIRTEDPGALAAALALAIEHRFTPKAMARGSDWAAIGRATRDVYMHARRQDERPPPPGAERLAIDERSSPSRLDDAAHPSGAMRLPRRALMVASCLTAAAAWLPGWALAEVPPPAAPVGFTGGGYHLAKNWDFVNVIRDASALRAEFYTRYIYGDGSLDHLNDEWSRYRDNGNHAFTPDGLSLVARAVGAPAEGKVESGMLRSRWQGQYGVFEIEMRVPRGPGLLSAFWLNPEDQQWPPEIDVVEIVNGRSEPTRRSYHFLHGAGVAGAKTFASKLNREHEYVPGFDYADAFHVFAVEWTPERVRHLVDGVLVADREFSWRHDSGKDAGAAHVLVNLAVGGKWSGPPDGATSLPASLQIRSMRVWQR